MNMGWIIKKNFYIFAPIGCDYNKKTISSSRSVVLIDILLSSALISAEERTGKVVLFGVIFDRVVSADKNSFLFIEKSML